MQAVTVLNVTKHSVDVNNTQAVCEIREYTLHTNTYTHTHILSYSNIYSVFLSSLPVLSQLSRIVTPHECFKCDKAAAFSEKLKERPCIIYRDTVDY
jgi:hypothetical protein